MYKRIFSLILFLLLLPFPSQVRAAAAIAEDITGEASISGPTDFAAGFLQDKNVRTYFPCKKGTVLRITHKKPMESLYILFNHAPGDYTILDNETGKTYTAGTNGFLHEYTNLTSVIGKSSRDISVAFTEADVSVSELYVFSQGDAPDFVQVWQPPLEGKTDLLLLSTHGDDEHLFFAGLLPLYAGERGYGVQVVYLTDHRNLTNTRVHEMLNGLWAVGVKAYPVFGPFIDFRIDDMEETYRYYEKKGISRDTLLEFLVTQVRRFRPQVIVGHDINGEYGHGMHMLYTDLLRKALPVCTDGSVFPESATHYGTWEVPKTYLHLYSENPITLDYDTPLDSFEGMTAFQVSQKRGFPCHVSQQQTWFTNWINGYNYEISEATQISQYNPCQFGLYQSTVGLDILKNDFMENIVSYAEQFRIAEEKRLEAERLEEEKCRQVEEERRRQEEEAEKRRQEEARRTEAERKRLELEAQQRQKAQEAMRQKQRSLVLAAGLLILLFVLLVLTISRFHTKRT